MRSMMTIGGMAVVLATSSATAQDMPLAKPIGNPAAWIPANGYPAAAQASGEQGRVGFTLMVDEKGRASDCKVTMSSESPLLDDTTCTFMIANARFDPPRDKKGRPVPSRWNSSVRWKIEAPLPPPAAPGQSTGPARP